MTLVDKLSRLLLAPPAEGWRALIYGLCLIAIPTILRIMLDELIQGRLAFFVYIPFVIAAGAFLETAYRLLRLKSEPMMTRFVSNQLAKSHYFDISAANRDLGYRPFISLQEGMNRLVEWLRQFPTR